MEQEQRSLMLTGDFFKVISDGTVNQEGITKIIDIPFNGCVTDGLLLNALESGR